LRLFGAQLLGRSGLAQDRADVVADVLLEGDLLGRTTHGLDLLPRYLREIVEGRMATSGDPEVVSDAGANAVWDGRYLPGPWLVKAAIDAARAKLASSATAVVVIRRSHHIGCLQAYLKPVTDEGRVILLTCSDPSTGGVAPHGAVASRITPNPIAFGFPTASGPVLVDVSLSTTTNAMTSRVHGERGRLPGAWLVDAEGRASDDPAVLFGERRGAILPLGGIDLGHKGFALALMVEALTSGLAGHGRADEPRQWGASVFLQLFDPERFAGRDAFWAQAGRLAELCRSAPVAPGRPQVRLPGEAALARKAAQLRDGVRLHPSVMPGLGPWAESLGVTPPCPLGE
jgi:L-lactate dehydrogenase